MKNKIVERIAKQIDVDNISEKLSQQISPGDLQSLLIEVYKNRAEALSPNDIFTQYKYNRFVQPSQINPLRFLNFDNLAFSLLSRDFEILELSPVAPLGASSVVSTINQNNAVSTIRNTEVCSDSTNVLALECARRREILQQDKLHKKDKVKLCASHRLLRTQKIDEAAAFQHFRIFGLCTAGQDEGSFKFETESLEEHIDFHLKLLTGFDKQNNNIKKIHVSITALAEKHIETLRLNVILK